MSKEYHAAETASKAGLQVNEPNRPTDANGDPIPSPAGQIFLTPEEREARRLAEAKDFFEANGLPERGTEIGDKIWDYFEGRKPVTPEFQAQVERRLASFLRDEDWVKRFNMREENAVRQFQTATAIIAAGKIQRQQG
jgi:hypothetical protein